MARDLAPLTSLSSLQFRPLAPLAGTAWRSLSPSPGFAAALARAETGNQTSTLDEAAARQAARDLEGVFLNLLWQQMWRTISQGPGSFLPGGLAGDIYRDFLTQAYATKMAEAGGIGLATLVLSHLDQ
ncbi:MAG: rod-binding protein [Bacillota bacterium]|nr:rod-binding protein [Bacillota bacterium]